MTYKKGSPWCHLSFGSRFGSIDSVVFEKMVLLIFPVTFSYVSLSKFLPSGKKEYKRGYYSSGIREEKFHALGEAGCYRLTCDPSTSIAMSHAGTQRCFLVELAKYSSDSFFDILKFLDPVECCILGLGCRTIHRLTEDERVWRHYCLMIRGFQAEKFQSLPFLKLLKSSVGFPTFKVLYVQLRSLAFSLIGTFRLMPPFSTLSLNGGLYCGRFVDNKLLFHMVNTAGNSVNDGNSFFIRYDATRKSLVASPCLSGPGFEMMIKLDTQINISNFEETVPNGGSAGGLLEMNGTRRPPTESVKTILKAMPSCCSPAVVPSTCELRTLFFCVGLFVAPYGAHGLEILHISLQKSEKEVNMDSTTMGTHNQNERGSFGGSFGNFGNFMLQGLKISGDPNVPAGELSFCVDMSNIIDPRAAYLADQRPVVTFPIDSASPEIFSLEERLDCMLFWARGYGQINRNPPVWDPEWVGCSYILYNSPLKNNARFSIIWDDESDFFRHAIDFVHLPEGDCPI